MLTTEEKQKMIDHRVKQYEVKVFDLQMQRTALQAVNDDKGVEDIDERISSLKLAIEAVKTMEV